MSQPSERERAPNSSYAEVLGRCQDIAIVFGNAQLAELFEHSGTALLNFAEHAENNSIQSQFFEAMGLIQRRRPRMERAFRQRINQGWDNFCGGVETEPETPPRGGRGSELSLLAQEEVEESLAAENLIIKANACLFPELYALSQRLAFVNGWNGLKDFQIPAGPHQLVQAFRHCVRELEVGVRIKVILYALFEKFVIKQAKPLYDELNDNLKDAGVLPNLKPVPIRTEAAQGPLHRNCERESQALQGIAGTQPLAANPEGNGQVSSSLGEELLGSIVELMSKRRHAGLGSQEFAAPSGTLPQAVGPTISAQELATAVGKVQAESSSPQRVRQRIAAAVQAIGSETASGFADRVKGSLDEERRQLLSRIDRDCLSPMDADLIDLIGMLFEFMLNDPLLPNLAKALLSHLHTPYLKVALIDPGLLVNAEHPARRLLDRMVEAGSLWVDERNPQRDIFPAMQRIVDRVLNDFSEDVALFQELLADFETAVKEQQRKTSTMEQRTKEAARGRERLQLAKQRAGREIRDLLHQRRIPEAVRDFLAKTWFDRLVFILLRDADEDHSDEWKQAHETARELLSLFDAQTDDSPIDPDRNGLEKLRKRIDAGVKHMGSYTHPSVGALLALLDAPQTWHDSSPEVTLASEPPDGHTTTDAVLGREHIGANQGEPSAQEQAIIERLRALKFGTWFEFRAANGDMPRRIKLSWLSSLTATCMFVDRSGMQAEIKTLQELANEMLLGRAMVIPPPAHPFIERTLVAIRNLLQGHQGKVPAGEKA